MDSLGPWQVGLLLCLSAAALLRITAVELPKGTGEPLIILWALWAFVAVAVLVYRWVSAPLALWLLPAAVSTHSGWWLLSRCILTVATSYGILAVAVLIITLLGSIRDKIVKQR